MTEHIVKACLELLKVPVLGPFRIYNQDIYARLLEATAEYLGVEQEAVQNAFEHMATFKRRTSEDK